MFKVKLTNSTAGGFFKYYIFQDKLDLIYNLRTYLDEIFDNEKIIKISSRCLKWN